MSAIAMKQGRSILGLALCTCRRAQRRDSRNHWTSDQQPKLIIVEERARVTRVSPQRLWKRGSAAGGRT